MYLARLHEKLKQHVWVEHLETNLKLKAPIQL